MGGLEMMRSSGALLLGLAALSLLPTAVQADCPSGEIFVHHDGSFETGYSWAGWFLPAPYGSFGEGYDLGPGVINCAAYWLTAMPPWGGLSADLYVWEGGVTREPAEVIALITGVYLSNTPYWPSVAENDYRMDVRVQGEFTVGYRDRQDLDASIFTAADSDGPSGHPWTYVPPDQGWPSGWQDPSVVWEPTSSLGIGVYFTRDATPAPATTWGAVKALFH
jgi:hypothetical protein